MRRFRFLFSLLFLKSPLIAFGSQTMDTYYRKPIDKAPDNEVSDFAGPTAVYDLADSNNYVIRGTVYDSETKETIPFVTVFTADNKIVVQSDANGKFEISLPKSYFNHKTIVRLSYVGYREKNMKLKKKYIKANISVYLNPANTVLD